jgi:hypothetical protein
MLESMETTIRVAVITGASQGIGRRTAEVLAGKGYAQGYALGHPGALRLIYPYGPMPCLYTRMRGQQPLLRLLLSAAGCHFRGDSRPRKRLRRRAASQSHQHCR